MFITIVGVPLRWATKVFPPTTPPSHMKVLPALGIARACNTKWSNNLIATPTGRVITKLATLNWSNLVNNSFNEKYLPILERVILGAGQVASVMRSGGP